MSDNKSVVYRIRNKNSGLYSKGAINSQWRSSTNSRIYFVSWASTRPKEWKSEALLKAHLLKAAQSNISMDDWEIVEVVELATRPIEEWFDHSMTMKLLVKSMRS